MAVRNYADDIRDSYRGDTKSLNCLREIAAHKQGHMCMTAELGKLGITLSNSEFSGSIDGDQSQLVAWRAELRRGMNALVEHGRAKPENLTNSLLDAVECLSAGIEIVDGQIKMNNVAEKHSSRVQGFGGPAESVLRDQSGQRIGTMLSNSDLRDPSTIANKLGVRNRHADSWNEGDGGPMSLGEFFRGVAGMRAPDSVRNALSEGTDTSGGYTVPSVLLPGILNALVPSSSLLQAGAHVAILDQQADSFRIAATDTIPTAAWRLEHGNVAESEPAFRGITITPRSLAFRFKVSRELLADAPGLDKALRTAIAQAFAKELDRAGLRGSGTAPEIRGLLNTVGVNALPQGVDGGTIEYSDFILAARAIKEADAPPPNAAIMSPREDAGISMKMDSTGQPLRRPEALADWKFLTSSQIPTNLTVGTSTDCSEIYIGDFSLFTFFIREGVSVQLLKELYAETGEVGFVCHTRVDVAAMYAKAFAVITGARG